MEFYTAIAFSVGFIYFLGLRRSLKRSLINGNMVNCCLTMSVLLVFLDCKINVTCTLGTGPANDKELAPRRLAAEVIQRALFSARENDIALLNMMWLNEHSVALKPEIAMARANGEQILFFSLYGDKIFPYLQCITHAHEAPIVGQLPPRQ
jgi:hypothetical protein